MRFELKAFIFSMTIHALFLGVVLTRLSLHDVTVHNMDMQLYIEIAKTFYVSTNPDVFLYYPLFPFFIRLFSFAGYDLAPLLVTFLFGSLSTVVFYKICKFYLDDDTSKLASIAFVFFPPSWFQSISSPLSEPVFLFFLLASFYYFKKSKIIASIGCAIIATLARSTGVLLLPLYAYLFYKERKASFIPLALTLILPTALLYFLFYLLTGDFFAYSKVMYKYWDYTPIFGFPFEGFVSGLLDTYSTISTYAKAYIVFTTAFYVIGAGLLWKSKHSELTLWAITFISFNFILSGAYGFGSIPRYSLPAFPVLIAYAMHFNKMPRKMLYLLMSIAFLFSIIFTLHEMHVISEVNEVLRNIKQ